MPDAAPARRATRTSLLVLLVALGPLALWAAFVRASMAVLPDHNPDGQCSGIGWGCQITPRDGMLLTGYLGVVTVVPVATALAAGLVRRSEPAARPKTAAGCLGGMAFWLAVGVALAAAK